MKKEIDKNWEKEFDELFNDTYWAEILVEAGIGDVNVNQVKVFIRNLLRQQREEIIKKYEIH